MARVAQSMDTGPVLTGQLNATHVSPVVVPCMRNLWYRLSLSVYRQIILVQHWREDSVDCDEE